VNNLKALVVLENHFFLDSNNKVWCDRVVDYNYLKRYLSVFDSILVTGRTQIVDTITDKKLLVSGENVVFIPMPDFKGAKGLILNIFKLKNIVKESIKKCDCAIYRAPTHLSLFTYQEVIKQHKPLVLEFMMAADKMFDGDGFIKNFLNKLIDKKAKKMCLKANGVSYVTEHILQERYPCKAILESNNTSSFTASYSSIDLPFEMYHKQNWDKASPPPTFNIIHTGYMDSYRKGQDVLIKAFKKVIDNGYKAKLIFIGDGEKKHEFEELANDLNLQNYIKFVGLVKEKNILFDYLKKSHILVFPTQSEGLPRTIIEAMSQGLVCISSPVDGIPELLDNEFLIDYTDVDGYANKIIELINDWQKCCDESNKNFDKSLRYEKSVLENKRINFYRNIEKGCKKDESKKFYNKNSFCLTR